LSKWEKLINKIVNLSPDMRFEQLKLVLESHGYVMRSGSGSHVVFFKDEHPSITVPKKHPIKVAYIKMVKEVVERGD
jgi:predicted RNA binding protein YcfA (HicA-like mRNA interferase family)